MPTFLESIGLRSSFNIPFVQLSPGTHHYEFQVDELFFNERPDGLIHNGKVIVLLAFKKAEGLFELTFTWDGYLEVICDNCLDVINYPVKGENQISVKVQLEPAEDEIDLIYITPNVQELSIYQLIYDFLILDLPMRKLCKNSLKESKKCNENVISYLNTDQDHVVESDGRWDKLKKLFNKEDDGSSET